MQVDGSTPWDGNKFAFKEVKKSSNLSIMMFPSVREKLKQDAANAGLSESEYVGRLVQKYKLEAGE